VQAEEADPKQLVGAAKEAPAVPRLRDGGEAPAPAVPRVRDGGEAPTGPKLRDGVAARAGPRLRDGGVAGAGPKVRARTADPKELVGAACEAPTVPRLRDGGEAPTGPKVRDGTGPKVRDGMEARAGPSVRDGGDARAGPRARGGADEPKQLVGAAVEADTQLAVGAKAGMPDADSPASPPADVASQKRRTSTSAWQGVPVTQWHRNRLPRSSLSRHHRTLSARAWASNALQQASALPSRPTLKGFPQVVAPKRLLRPT